MPKIKTHSGAKKRFALTKNGKVKRAHAGKRHLLNGHGKTTKLKRGLRKGGHLLNGHGKTTKLKRGLRKGGYADKTNEAAIKRMILYK